MSQISWNIKNFLSLDEEDFGLPVLEALVKNSNMKKTKILLKINQLISFLSYHLSFTMRLFQQQITIILTYQN